MIYFRFNAEVTQGLRQVVEERHISETAGGPTGFVGPGELPPLTEDPPYLRWARNQLVPGRVVINAETLKELYASLAVARDNEVNAALLSMLERALAVPRVSDRTTQFVGTHVRDRIHDKALKLKLYNLLGMPSVPVSDAEEAVLREKLFQQNGTLSVLQFLELASQYPAIDAHLAIDAAWESLSSPWQPHS